MESTSKKYYLETNTLYSLINKIHIFIDRVNVATSLFAYDELISGIDEMQYHKRRVLISKLKASGLKIYPYLPAECIAMSFGIDISNCPPIIDKKAILWEQVNLVISCDNYLEYTSKLHEILNVKFSEEKEANDIYEHESTNLLNTLIKKNSNQLREINERRKIEPEFYRIEIEELLDNSNKRRDYTVERDMLVHVLKACNISFDETDIDNAIMKYDGCQLSAYIFGETSYMLNRSYNLGSAGRNDIFDLIHLLYLRDENDVIVSNDKIFANSTMAQMRITSDEFAAMFSK